jgi:hypothetical protein
VRQVIQIDGWPCACKVTELTMTLIFQPDVDGKTTDGLHQLCIGVSGSGKPLLSALSVEQRQQLQQWIELQPKCNGTLDLTGWPGWTEAGKSPAN